MPDDFAPPKGPKQQPAAGTDGGAATDGYGLRDAAGPRYYVTFDAQGNVDFDALLAAQQRVIPGLDATTISVRTADDSLVIDGHVASHDISRQVAALVTRCAPGTSVVNCLAIADMRSAS